MSKCLIPLFFLWLGLSQHLHARIIQVIVNVPAFTDPTDTISIATSLDSVMYHHSQSVIQQGQKWTPNIPLEATSFLGSYLVKLEVSEYLEKLEIKVTKNFDWDQVQANIRGEDVTNTTLNLTESIFDLKSQVSTKKDTFVINVENWIDHGPLKNIEAYSHLGSFHKLHIDSKILDRKVELSVWLPRSNKKLPVVYFQDGHTLFFPEHNSPHGHLQIAEAMQRDAWLHKNPCIIVGITPQDRDAEYDVLQEEGAKYIQFLGTELVSFIESQFGDQIIRTRENRIIAGASKGGVISLAALNLYSDVFAKGIGISIFASMFNADSEKYQKLPLLRKQKKYPTFMYVDCGDEGSDWGYEDDISLMIQSSRETNHLLQFEFKKFPYAEHNEVSWSRRIGYVLNQVLQH